MLEIKRDYRKPNQADSSATGEDFHKLFATEMTDLLRLALLLTADGEEAERCLILAMNDCFSHGVVAKDFIRVWARRAIICRAIHLVFGADGALRRVFPDQQMPHPQTCCGQYAMEALSESLAIVRLPDFERHVFVICGVERYRIQDCALLLNKSASEVCDSLRRATSWLVSAEIDQHFGSKNMCSNSCVAGERDVSCGTTVSDASRNC
jgi:hypothetical protein